MDVNTEIAKIVEMFNLDDMGYALEALDYVLDRIDLDPIDRVVLGRAVLARHFGSRDES